MKNPALKREVSNKQNKMLTQRNSRLRKSSIVSYNLDYFTCLTELNFWNSGKSSLGLKPEASLPRM